MPDTGAPWNIPYVDPTDLVRDYPQASEDLADAIADGLDAAGSAGIGPNVVQTVKLDTFTTTSTSYTTVTGLSVTITPTSNTSKVLLIAQVNFSNEPSVDNTGYFLRLAGSDADTYVGDAASNRTRAAAYSRHTGADYPQRLGIATATLVFLSSPATGSPVTYSVEARVGGSGALTVNQNGPDIDNLETARTPSSITVIEVAV